jgi:hypothetical protein
MPQQYSQLRPSTRFHQALSFTPPSHLHQHVPHVSVTAQQAESPEAAAVAPHDGHVSPNALQVDDAVWVDLNTRQVLPWQLNIPQLNILWFLGTSASVCSRDALGLRALMFRDGHHPQGSQQTAL